MNASEAKEKVLKVWPDAELVGYFDGVYAIFSRLAHHASTTGYIGWGQTTYKVSSTLASSQAWIDAASRLPEEKEPAPKEGETAKVESRDALPPLGEFGFEQFNGRSDVWEAIVEIREDQLRASLLREKGKDEEIEPLKGLMERACNVLSSGIVGMPEEVRREARMVVREYIKAAVTGEQR